MPDFEKLKKLCQLVRYDILTSTTAAESGHATSSLSAVELMTTLFFTDFLRYDLEHPENPANDRFILSKGHASPLLYSLYHVAGVLTLDELLTLRTFNSPLEGHPTPRFKYIDVATGSLGQGLSIGLGMALGMRLSSRRLFVNSILKESNIHKKNNNQKQSVGNTNFDVEVSQVNFHNDFSSNITARTIENLPKNKLIVNDQSLVGVSTNKRPGRISIDPNQVADKLVNNPDKTLNQDFADIGRIIKNHSNKFLARVWVLLGDSEMSEGQVWETMQIASYYKLNNLIAVVDVNRLGQRGETMSGWDLQTYAKRAEAFGWETIVIDDGHDLEQVYKAYEKALKLEARSEKLDNKVKNENENPTSHLNNPASNLQPPTSNKPVMIFAKTTKGKGLSFWEDKNGWHGKAVPKEQLEVALKELGEIDLSVRGKIQKPLNLKVRSEKLDNEVRNENENPTSHLNNPSSSLSPHTSYMLGQMIATREAYGDALVALGETDERIVVLDAEVSNSTYAEKFAEKFPNRYFEMFIAEQNMVSTALGLSKFGYVPFVSSFSSFLTRAFDQIRMAQYSVETRHASSLQHRRDVIDHVSKNLKIVGSHAGVFLGKDGPSQMGLEDFAMFRSILNSTVLCGADGVSAFKLTQKMLPNEGITYLRTMRDPLPVIYSPDEEFEIGGSKILRQSPNDRAVIFAVGVTVHEGLKAWEELKKEQISLCIVDLYSIKPIDQSTIQKLAMKVKNVIVIEDHYPYGGLGEAVLTALISKSQIPITNQIPNPNNQSAKKLGQLEIRSIRNFIHLSVNKLPRSGKPEELLHYEEIDAQAIVKKVKDLTSVHPTGI